MNKNIFHSTSMRLAGLYLLIIMIISFTFSVWVYRISAQELERGIKSQQGPVGQVIRQRMVNEDTIAELLKEEKKAIEDSKKRLVNDLLFLNLVILLAGGMLSYYLARLSLTPIEEAHEAQSRFTADASHELRTPITAMRAEIELALTDKKLTLKDAKKQLQSNLEELDKLTELSAGLLQLSRLENNGLEKESVEIDEILASAVAKVLPHAEAKKQLINLPKQKDAVVYANKTSLREALTTILDNAIKYSPNKSEISIKTSNTKNKVRVDIADKGSGIKASELPHIFDRFYRADQSRNKNKVGGYGLGLSIAKSIIDAHNGQISAKSAVGKGTTFTITLPLK